MEVAVGITIISVVLYINLAGLCTQTFPLTLNCLQKKVSQMAADLQKAQTLNPTKIQVYFRLCECTVSYSNYSVVYSHIPFALYLHLHSCIHMVSQYTCYLNSALVMQSVIIKHIPSLSLLQCPQDLPPFHMILTPIPHYEIWRGQSSDELLASGSSQLAASECRRA